MADGAKEDTRADELFHPTPVFPGMWRYLKGRLGRPKPPQNDPIKVRVQFRPCFKVTAWNGSSDDHRTEECAPPSKCAEHGRYGQHSEVRPNGFDWEGTHFHGLFDALENQAFQKWYEEGGQEVLEEGKLIQREPQYREGKRPPLPTFNFFLHENIVKMTGAEILAYRRTGEVPKRLRRRGRNKPKSEALEE